MLLTYGISRCKLKNLCPSRNEEAKSTQGKETCVKKRCDEAVTSCDWDLVTEEPRSRSLPRVVRDQVRVYTVRYFL